MPELVPVGRPSVWGNGKSHDQVMVGPRRALTRAQEKVISGRRLANGYTGNTLVSRSDWPRPADDDRRPQRKKLQHAIRQTGDKSKHRAAVSTEKASP